jgi:hypothetical protein
MWNAKSGSSGILIHIPEWISEEALIEAGTAGDQRGAVDFTGRWRSFRAPGKGIHAEDKRSFTTAV